MFQRLVIEDWKCPKDPFRQITGWRNHKVAFFQANFIDKIHKGFQGPVLMRAQYADIGYFLRQRRVRRLIQQIL